METRTVPEIRRSKVEVKDVNDPKELKKLLDSLSEFGFAYEYDNKKNRIKIRGEIDWCDDEFTGVTDNNIELGVTVYNKLTVIRLRQRVGENIKIKDVYLPFPVKSHYFRKSKELILDLGYRGTE